MPQYGCDILCCLRLQVVSGVGFCRLCENLSKCACIWIASERVVLAHRVALQVRGRHRLCQAHPLHRTQTQGQ